MSVLLHSELTGEITGAAFEVWRVLGYGFLEKVYENTLVVELGLRNLKRNNNLTSTFITKEALSDITQAICLRQSDRRTKSREGI